MKATKSYAKSKEKGVVSGWGLVVGGQRSAVGPSTSDPRVYRGAQGKWSAVSGRQSAVSSL
ncbi:MAG: hypothetical protein RL021_1810 [Bacteroidota bacterium]